MLRRGIAKILHEAKQRRFGIRQISLSNLSVAIVVSRNRENQRLIMLVRLVKLGVVEGALPIEVNDVAQMVQEGGPFTCSRLIHLFLHCGCNGVLCCCSMNPSCIPYAMEDEFARRFRGVACLGIEDVKRNGKSVRRGLWDRLKSGHFLHRGDRIAIGAPWFPNGIMPREKGGNQIRMKWHCISLSPNRPQWAFMVK